MACLIINCQTMFTSLSFMKALFSKGKSYRKPKSSKSATFKELLQPQRQPAPSFVATSIPLEKTKEVMQVCMTKKNGQLEGNFRVVTAPRRPYFELHPVNSMEIALQQIERTASKNSIIYYWHKGLQNRFKGKTKTHNDELEMRQENVQSKAEKLNVTLKNDKRTVKSWVEELKKLFERFGRSG